METALIVELFGLQNHEQSLTDERRVAEEAYRESLRMNQVRRQSIVDRLRVMEDGAKTDKRMRPCAFNAVLPETKHHKHRGGTVKCDHVSNAEVLELFEQRQKGLMPNGFSKRAMQEILMK